MSSFVSTYFEFDGISSDDMGVQLVRVETGLLNSQFAHNQTPITDKVKGRNKEYFFGVELSLFKFSITIALLEDQLWTREMRMRIAEWLFKSQYKPFISGDNLDVIYYCIADGDASRFDNTLQEGYITIDFTCNSPYAYTPTYVNTYDYTTAPTNIITVENLSNVETRYCPELEITMVAGTSITITNLTNGGIKTIFTGLTIGEIIYVNNQSKQIISSLPNTYRLGNFNKNWLKLVKGVNRLQIDGNANIVIKSSFPITL